MKPWCIARYYVHHETKEPQPFCKESMASMLCDGPPHNLLGPLAMTKMPDEKVRPGFPGGGIGSTIMRFATEREAQGMIAEWDHDRPPASHDVATRLDAMHFYVTRYSHWDGSHVKVYDGGDFDEAVAAAAQDRSEGDNYRKVTIHVRPVAAERGGRAGR